MGLFNVNTLTANDAELLPILGGFTPKNSQRFVEVIRQRGGIKDRAELRDALAEARVNARFVDDLLAAYRHRATS